MIRKATQLMNKNAELVRRNVKWKNDELKSEKWNNEKVRKWENEKMRKNRSRMNMNRSRLQTWKQFYDKREKIFTKRYLSYFNLSVERICSARQTQKS